MSYQCRAYDLPSVRALVEYHHATMGWPTKAGFLSAIKRGHLRSFPGLTLSAATRYCPAAATPTVMGHMTQVQQGIRSTKLQPPPRPPATPMQPNDLNIKVVELSTLYTDDLGRFPIQSFNGNNYIMLAHHVGSNSILVEPFKSRADAHRIPAYNNIMKRLWVCGITVELQIFDNEASDAYIANITNKWKCKHQKVPLTCTAATSPSA